MKKTLALLLALLMMLSVAVAFVSCENNEEEPENTDDPFIFQPANTDDGTGDGTEDGSDNGNSTASSMTPASGTVYFLYAFKVRQAAKASSKSIGTVDYGSSAELIEMNDKWSKIKFTSEGITKEGYVYNVTYTANQADITLITYETPKTGKAANLGTSGLKVRTTPWNCGQVTVDDAYTDCNVQADIKNGFCSVKNDTALEITGEVKDTSGKVLWYYVKCTVTGKENKSYTIEGYAWHEYVAVDGEATNPTTPGEPQKPVISPV